MKVYRANSRLGQPDVLASQCHHCRYWDPDDCVPMWGGCKKLVCVYPGQRTNDPTQARTSMYDWCDLFERPAGLTADIISGRFTRVTAPVQKPWEYDAAVDHELHLGLKKGQDVDHRLAPEQGVDTQETTP